jgi:hypothetical protein
MSEHMTPVMYVDPSGEFGVMATIAIISGIILAVNLTRTIVKANKINKAMDELVNSTYIDYGDFNELTTEDKYAMLEQEARFSVYENKRNAIKTLNWFRIFVLLPVKKYDKLGQANDFLEPSDVAPDLLIGLETGTLNYLMDLGVSVNDPNFFNYYDWYVSQYRYWEEHYND